MNFDSLEDDHPSDWDRLIFLADDEFISLSDEEEEDAVLTKEASAIESDVYHYRNSDDDKDRDEQVFESEKIESPSRIIAQFDKEFTRCSALIDKYSKKTKRGFLLVCVNMRHKPNALYFHTSPFNSSFYLNAHKMIRSFTAELAGKDIIMIIQEKPDDPTLATLFQSIVAERKGRCCISRNVMKCITSSNYLSRYLWVGIEIHDRIVSYKFFSKTFGMTSIAFQNLEKDFVRAWNTYFDHQRESVRPRMCPFAEKIPPMPKLMSFSNEVRYIIPEEFLMQI